MLSSSRLRVIAAFKAFLAQNEKPKIHVWRFYLVGDSKTCNQCSEFKDEVYQLENEDDLLEFFPYGSFAKEDLFECNIHPNCRCIVEMDKE